MTNVTEARQRLDKTLSSPALSDSATLFNLVRKQLLKSSSGSTPADQVVEKKSKQLFTLLEALRSAIADGEWKVKQDSPRLRVMYRAGPEGTPFHSLCLDGIIDGPMSSALVVGWEAPLYKEWWPQFSAPSFKIVESRWLQRGTVGGDLSLLRFSVPWPLATREVLLSAYELDYFDEDLIAVMYTSAPVEPDEKVDGICGDQVPKLRPNVVRMDLDGGFVLQKISPECNFFRVVVDLDMKLDYVPPWLINFIARQLVGHGYKLYQKAVAGVKDSPFEKLVKSEPMYRHIQAAIECMSPNLHEPTLVPMLPSENDMFFFKEASKERDLDAVESAYKMLSERDLSKRLLEKTPSVRLERAEVLVESNTLTNGLAVHHAQPPTKLDPALNVGGDIPTSQRNASLPVTFAPELEEQLRPDVESDVASSDPEVVWALDVLNKLILHLKKQKAEKANSQASGSRGNQKVSNGDTGNEPRSSPGGTAPLHEVRGSSDHGQGSSLQNATLKHIMYSSERLQSTEALGKGREEATSANGVHNGTDRKKEDAAPTAAATGRSSKAGWTGARKTTEVKPQAEGADTHNDHARQKVHRFFQPFRLRKLRKEGKPPKTTTKVLQ